MTRTMPDRLSDRMTGWTEGLALHALVATFALLLRLLARRDRRVRQALQGRRTVYLFRSGRAVRRLCLARGRVRSRRGEGAADFTMTFLDLPGTLRHLARSPNDVLGLKATNKVATTGNLGLMFRLGYLAGLATSRLRPRQAA